MAQAKTKTKAKASKTRAKARTQTSAKKKATKNDLHAVQEKAGDLAKQIWLAGLGAYGRAFDEAREQMDELNEHTSKFGKQTTKFFDDLVAKGRKLERDTSKTVSKRSKEMRSKSSSLLEERISKVRESLHFDLSGINPYNKLDELSRKIDQLNRKVDALSKPKASSTRSRTTRKASSKSTARKSQ